MRSSVVYYILLLLDTNDAVQIPRVGRLKRKVYPSRTNFDEREVHPPHATIQFSSELDENDVFLQKFIAHSTGRSIEEIDGHVSSFGKAIIEGLENSGRIEVDSLGTFYKRGDDILFAADNASANLGFAGLRTVKLPEPKVLEVKPAEITASAVFASTHSEKTDETRVPVEPRPSVKDNDDDGRVQKKERGLMWLVPLFTIVFLLVAALAVTTYLSRENDEGYPSTTFNRSPVPEPITAPASDDTMPDTQVEEPLAGENSATDGQTDFTQEGVADIEDSSFEKSTYRDIDTDEAGLDLPLPESNTTKDVQPVVETPDETSLVPNDVADADPASPAGSPADCDVVVGAFGVQSNVDRMLEKLESMGYPARTILKNNLTQVSVPAPCNTPEIDELLIELRASVESQAWIRNK